MKDTHMLIAIARDTPRLYDPKVFKMKASNSAAVSESTFEIVGDPSTFETEVIGAATKINTPLTWC